MAVCGGVSAVSQAGGGEVHELEECGRGDGVVSGVGEVSEMIGFTQMAQIKAQINTDKKGDIR